MADPPEQTQRTVHTVTATARRLDETERALELAIAGATPGAVARILGVSKSTAKRRIQAGLEMRRDEIVDDARLLRSKLDSRLERIQSELWQRLIIKNSDGTVSLDLEIVDRLLKVADRYSKLWGIDAPVRTLDVTPPETMLDLSGLSGDELAHLEQLHAKIERAPAGQPSE